ncbi:TPA: NAD-dependent epimerase/dehydratase family protein [Vibrio cholerae]|uniref:NAD-dependent epimerase/dehydratase family protein n=1 Tax=Vibrio cholerae TaxID=666 RepID=UPI0002A1C9AE|nr:NAD(P)-dependent oxidoreductase [Vibrio cholerae]EGR1452165.1 NAD(P)-dependent oxidoreductase [Vibrio cholerae]EGR2041061.1 NAD(P)-dependent oxidoreductase [Vibrio cholerae]EGR2064874.1 NAD(P)-dependent oxidoreductase [Vibrio cholerae]EGR2116064.1 NAD(P)-dependent oxidoreductase [Vibrio cholerae]EGR2244928.1 NAD(P)-dependent oxidoreductase [Vibrio cholerae]
MRILVTGSAGRVGRAIYIKLMRTHDVVGIDKTPCSTADYIGDIRDSTLIDGVLKNIDVIVHTAALHAPHVGLVPDSEFTSINVDATEKLALAGVKAGVKHFIFTSTTALYGYASTPKSIAGWIDEEVTPQPKSIYHKSKIAAETKLEEISNLFQFPVTVLQMSRCFPEPADLMAVFRLTRGIDARDVANAHLCAVEKRLSGFNRFIISGATPFHFSDCKALYTDAGAVIKRKCPEIALAFQQRSWQLPQSLDRVYDSSSAHEKLGWSPIHGFESVLEMLDTETAEVLPVLKRS